MGVERLNVKMDDFPLYDPTVIAYKLVRIFPGSPKLGTVVIAGTVNSVYDYDNYDDFWKPILKHEAVSIETFTGSCGVRRLDAWIERNISGPYPHIKLHCDGRTFTHRDFVQALHLRSHIESTESICVRPTEFLVGCVTIKREEIERISKLMEDII